MKKADIKKLIKETANKYGFEVYHRANGFEDIGICDDYNERYVNFTIYEDPKWIMETNTVEITVRVTAAISRMGGKMTADDLMNASIEIRKAAMMIDDLDKVEMKYVFGEEE